MVAYLILVRSYSCIVRIPAEHIEPELKATERFGAIEELLNRLFQAGAIPQNARTTVSVSLAQRERIMSTGIGFGFALPHAASDLISESIAAFGRSRAGIDFASLDGRPVEFVLLYIVATGGDTAWLRPLARTGRYISAPEDDVRKSLRNCSTAEEMAEILKKLFDGDEPQT